jgi:hypothetical protein
VSPGVAPKAARQPIFSATRRILAVHFLSASRSSMAQPDSSTSPRQALPTKSPQTLVISTQAAFWSGHSKAWSGPPEYEPWQIRRKYCGTAETNGLSRFGRYGRTRFRAAGRRCGVDRDITPILLSGLRQARKHDLDAWKFLLSWHGSAPPAAREARTECGNGRFDPHEPSRPQARFAPTSTGSGAERIRDFVTIFPAHSSISGKSGSWSHLTASYYRIGHFGLRG